MRACTRRPPISGGNESAGPMHHLSCRGPVNVRLNYRPLSGREEGEGGDKRVYKRRLALTSRLVNALDSPTISSWWRPAAPQRLWHLGRATRNYPNALTSLVLIVLFGPDRIARAFHNPMPHSSFARAFSRAASFVARFEVLPPLHPVDELGSRRLVLRID